MTIEDRIRKFAKDPDVIINTYAMLKVGRDQGDSPEEIMANVIFSLLMQFYGIPLKKGLN